MSTLIHHYTDFHGVNGILAHDAFRASHARFLRDGSEVSYGFEKFVEELAAICDIDRHSAGLRRFEQDWIGQRDNIVSLFMTCFSRHASEPARRDGLLSQWRARTGPGGAYALGFDTTGLAAATEQQRANNHFNGSAPDWLFLLFDTVHYGQIPFVVLDAIYEHRTSFRNLLLDGAGGGDALTTLLTLAAQCAAFCKHASYAEEAEHRFAIAFPGLAGSDREAPLEGMAFFERDGIGVPFIQAFRGLLKPCLREILVGPAPDWRMRVKSLEMLLQHARAHHVTVRVSDIPHAG